MVEVTIENCELVIGRAENVKAPVITLINLARRAIEFLIQEQNDEITLTQEQKDRLLQAYSNLRAQIITAANNLPNV